MPSLEATCYRHAAAVVAGDAAAVASDFTPEGMAKALETADSPASSPVAAFEIRAIGEHQAEITFLGEVNRTMRTTWRETRPGKWQIVDILEVVN